MFENGVATDSKYPWLNTFNEESESETLAEESFKRENVRFKPLNDFVDLKLRDVRSGSALAVYLLMFRCAKGDVATLTRTWMAEICGYNVSTITNAVKELEEIGVVRRVQRGLPNRSMSVFRLMPLRR